MVSYSAHWNSFSFSEGLNASCYPLLDGTMAWQTQVVHCRGHSAGPVTLHQLFRDADAFSDECIMDNQVPIKLPVFVEITLVVLFSIVIMYRVGQYAYSQSNAGDCVEIISLPEPGRMMRFPYLRYRQSTPKYIDFVMLN